MPRQARTISHTSIYHAILRSVNKQQVFVDETYMAVQNMRNLQNIIICCGSAEPVPLTRNE